MKILSSRQSFPYGLLIYTMASYMPLQLCNATHENSELVIFDFDQLHNDQLDGLTEIRATVPDLVLKFINGITYASITHNTTPLQTLVDQGVDVNYVVVQDDNNPALNQSLLTFAILSLSPTVVQFMIDHSVNVNGLTYLPHSIPPQQGKPLTVAQNLNDAYSLVPNIELLTSSVVTLLENAGATP